MQRMCKLCCGAVVVFALGTSLLAQPTPRYELGFDIPTSIEGSAGSAFFRTVTGTLTSDFGVQVTTPDGAQAWQLGIVVEGKCELSNPTTAGTVAALDIDGGLRSLEGGSFESTELVNRAASGVFPHNGLVSAVVLSFAGSASGAVTLPSEGVASLIKFDIEDQIPSPVNGVCEPNVCRLAYVDGLVGSGEPIDNKVTYRGRNIVPVKGDINVELCAFQGEFALGFDVNKSLEGVAGSNVLVDASATLTSGKTDDSPGAQGWQIAFTVSGDGDVNDVSTAGTAGDLTINGGYRNPGGGFELTEHFKTFPGGVGRDSVVQAVLLDFNSILTLPPSGTVNLVNLTIDIPIPSSNADGSCSPNVCSFDYVDGLQGSGDPVANFVTFRGASIKPALNGTVLNACPFQGDFALGFDVPAEIEGSGGGSVDFTATATLTSGKAEDSPGAQGWQIGLVVSGDCDFQGTSTAGTAADLTLNGGFRSIEGGFELTESFDVFVQGVGQTGVIQAVVVDFSGGTSLPPTGTVSLVDVNMSSGVNSSNVDGSCIPNVCSFEYVNGLSGSGDSINNVITFQGANVQPTLAGATTSVCHFQGSFELGFSVPSEVEGAAGTTVEYTASATLSSNEAEAGAQGWQIGFVIAGDCELKEVSIAGTASDLTINGGNRNPSGGFELTESFKVFSGGVGQDGVIQAVVVDFDGVLTLPPTGTANLVDAIVTAAVNPATALGDCDPNICTFNYVDGLSGSGSPITNLVTFQGANVRPGISGAMTSVCRLGADFALGFDSPVRAEGRAGEVSFQFTANATLASSNLPTDNGAQGYQIAVAADGWDIVDATLDGTTAGDTLVLGDSFSVIELTDEGVVAAIVLSLTTGATLPPSGSASLLALTLEGAVPSAAPGGACEPTICTLSYPDSLDGSGGPVRNLITYEGDNVAPTRGSVSTDICPFSGDFSLGFAVPDLVEGATGSFAVFDVRATLTAGDLPTNRGAQGWDISVQVGGGLSRLLGASVAGTDADLDLNGGLRPAGGSFEQTEVNVVLGTASSRVVMDFNGAVTLPSSGTAGILRLTVEADVPALTSMECDPNICTFAYVGSNLVTYEGADVQPTLSGGQVEICPFNPEFALGFDGPAGVIGPIGGSASFDVLATLASQGIEGDDGAQGWQIAIGAEGCSVAAATAAGTDAGGALVPGSSFEATSLVDGGVTSAIVLDLNALVTLPPNGSSSILAVTLEASVPDPVAFQCRPSICSLFYQDGLGGVSNRVTFRGGNVFPSLGSAAVEVCPDIPSQARFSVAVAAGSSADKEGSRALWTVETASAGPLDVQASVLLDSTVEPCASDPSLCNGGENTIDGEVYGCSDGADNDGDGLIDADDPDCRGVQGWSISVRAADCFDVQGATTTGTAGDLALNGGVRDTQSFERTEVVNPADNGGQSGVVSAVVLSLALPITLPNLEESLVLLIDGRIDASGVAPGGMTEPCDVDIVPADETGLQGAGLPVKTAVSIAGQTANPAVCNASVKVLISEVVPPTEFIRCDPNDDGTSNIADAIWLVAEIFNNGGTSSCQKSADCNNDGGVDVSDATFSITYRFMDGAPPSAPFPDCGIDPTDDDLSCDSSSCP